MPDNRRYRRFPLRQAVLIRNDASSRTLVGSVVDISEAGVGVELAGDFQINALLTAWFVLRDQRLLGCWAMLRHQSGNRRGLEFINQSLERTEFIRSIIDHPEYARTSSPDAT
jgi:PilZ domain-containing protein